ncbi:MAG: serine/threonine protein kinase [Deltaproteobacteria bacterium]|nr:serine/threonine protein kinase [Deltaproteobacteria bacterium]MBK8714316.1 serine/threonine protein kinase [Deltaproteobacteria bacterium]
MGASGHEDPTERATPAKASSQDTTVGARLMRDALAQRLFGLETPRGPTCVGRFVLVKCIGEGGMGTVYRAFDPELERWVALKLLRGGADEGARARMMREGQAMARVNHPNVVPVYEVGAVEIDGAPRVFVAMEFVRGVDLAAWMRQHPPGDAARRRVALDLIVQAGRGLAAAHDAGLVHRDFKPANVLVGDDGRVRVADFGLARAEHAVVSDPVFPTGVESAAQGLTQSGTIMGTPAYMAPEQVAGGRVDARADQYSFCVSAWEVLFGRRPHLDETAVGDGRDVEIPPWLRAVLERGAAEEPGDRFSSMTELVDALQRDPTRRRRRIVAATATVGIACAAFVGHRIERGHRCDDATAALDGVWAQPQRDALRQRGETPELPGIPAVVDLLGQAVDAHAQAWSTAAMEICTAARIRGEMADDEYALAVACLDDRLARFEALTDVLVDAGPEQLGAATNLLSRMLAPTDCRDPKRFYRQPPLPDEPALAEQVTAVRRAMVRAAAVRGAGHVPEALAQIDALIERARSLGWAPLLPELMYERGMSVRIASADGDPSTEFSEAYWLALEGGDDTTAARAATELMGLAHSENRLADAAMWGRYAEIFGARAGETVDDHRWRLSGAARVHVARGELEAAEQAAREAVAVMEAHYGEDHPAIAGALSDLGVTLRRRDRLDDAVAVLERAIAIQEQAYGATWYGLALPLTNLGHVLDQLGRYDDARRVLQRALEVTRAHYGPRHLKTLSAAADVATTWMNTGELERAVAEMNEVERAYAGTPDTSPGVLVLQANLSEALLLDGRCAEGLERLRAVEPRFAAVHGERAPQTLRARTRTCVCEAELEPRAAGPAACAEVLGQWFADRPQDDGRFAAQMSVARQTWRRGELEVARDLLESLEQEYERDAQRSAIARQLRARVLVDLGEAEVAVRLSTEAWANIAATAQFQPTLLAQLTLHIEVLRRAGRSAEAEGAIARARALARTERQRENVERAAATP